MKNALLVSLALMWAMMVDAQSNVLGGFVVGAVAQQNTTSVLGQPFVSQSAGDGFQVTEGMAQAQLVREIYNDTVNKREGYNQHGFVYPVTTPVGSYHNQMYFVHGAPYQNDLLKVLDLEVVDPFPCGIVIYDVDHNEYPTVKVGGYCWTKTNLKTEHYSDGVTQVGNAVYHSLLYGNEASNLANFGRLYTWYSALNVPEDGSVLPAPDEFGCVQGVCPEGWHIPTMEEIMSLFSYSATSLRSTEHWVQSNENTDETHFSALPAGEFNNDANRFEGLHSQTHFWTMGHSASDAESIALFLPYYCDNPMLVNRDDADALSVRCVKD